MNFLSSLVLLALVKNAFCSSDVTGLDILASVALSPAAFNNESSLALTPRQQRFVDRIASSLAHSNSIPPAHLDFYRSQILDKKTYLLMLFKLMSKQKFESFNISVKMVIFKEFDVVSSEHSEVTSLLDMAALHPLTSKALGIRSCISGNLSLLKRLVECNVFNLNDEFTIKDFTGNSIVLLKNQPKCLEFAIERGLNLEQPVKAEGEFTHSAISFLRMNGKADSLTIARLATLKRPLSDSDLGTSSFKPSKAIAKPSGAFETSEITLDQEDEITFNNLISQNDSVHKFEDFVRLVLRKYGPSVVLRLVTAKPRLLDHESLLPLLLEALSLSEIAKIYAVDHNRTLKNSDNIRGHFQDPGKFSTFLFEVLKICKRPRFVYKYPESLIAVQDEATLKNLLDTHDFSALPENLLRGIAFYAVRYNLIALLLKVAETNRNALDGIFRVGVDAPIYGQVNSAVMLKLLLDLKVRTVPLIRTCQGHIPILYFFLSMKNPEITKEIFSRYWHPSFISNALAHASQQNDLETSEILSHLADK